jgi:hypothetical protein
MSGVILAALMSLFLLFPGAASAQRTNAASSPERLKVPDAEDVAELLNDTAKAYSEALSGLEADANRQSDAAPKNSEAALEGLLKTLMQSDGLDDALAATARSVGLWERILINLPGFFLGALASILAAALTLSGDRLLKHRKLRRRAKAIQGVYSVNGDSAESVTIKHLGQRRFSIEVAFDKEMMERIGRLKVGEGVAGQWTVQEHYRIDSVETAEEHRAAKKTE